jgi:hypothetical protein
MGGRKTLLVIIAIFIIFSRYKHLKNWITKPNHCILDRYGRNYMYLVNSWFFYTVFTWHYKSCPELAPDFEWCHISGKDNKYCNNN